MIALIELLHNRNSSHQTVTRERQMQRERGDKQVICETFLSERHDKNSKPSLRITLYFYYTPNNYKTFMFSINRGVESNHKLVLLR